MWLMFRREFICRAFVVALTFLKQLTVLIDFTYRNKMHFKLLGSLFVLVAFTCLCQAAPHRQPPATTIVSAFKQALSSAEDESVEATEQVKF